MPISIILAGHSRNGKSTLGNILADDKPFNDNDTSSCVTVTQSVTINDTNRDICIINTPDLQKGINISETLKTFETVGNINAIFYVYSWRKKQPFKGLTTFYERLFSKPSLEKNLVLVKMCDKHRLTNFSDSNIAMKLVGLITPPIIINVFDELNSQELQAMRINLLHIAASFEQIKIRELKVPKLQTMLDRDRIHATRIVDEIKRKGELADETIIADYTNELVKMEQCKTQLAILDTDEPVNIDYRIRIDTADSAGSLTITTGTRLSVPIICDKRGFYFQPFQCFVNDAVDLVKITQSYVTVKITPQSVAGMTGGILYARAYKKNRYAKTISSCKDVLLSCQKKMAEIKLSIEGHYTQKVNNEIAVLQAQYAMLLNTHINFADLEYEQGNYIR